MPCKTAQDRCRFADDLAAGVDPRARPRRPCDREAPSARVANGAFARVPPFAAVLARRPGAPMVAAARRASGRAHRVAISGGRRRDAAYLSTTRPASVPHRSRARIVKQGVAPRSALASHIAAARP